MELHHLASVRPITALRKPFPSSAPLCSPSLALPCPHQYPSIPLSLLRSKVLRFWSFGKPHHLAFQLSWMSFFIAFFATFTAAPLLPIIRNDLDLTKQDISAGAIASVTGAV